MSNFSRSLTRKPAISFESLEQRHMMAGNLTAQLVNGTLFINEASGNLGLDQAVRVSQLSDGRIKVEGQFNVSGGQTLINGQKSLVFAHPTNLVIGTGGGNDTISVVGVSAQHMQILAESPNGSGIDKDTVILDSDRTSGQVDIRTGAGNDLVMVMASTIGDGTPVNNNPDDLKITTGVPSAVGEADKDHVLIHSTKTRAATIISTGASGDTVNIVNSALGNDLSDFLSISTGAGADVVNIAPPPDDLQQNFQSVAGNILITAFDSALENDVDTVKMKQLFFESASIQLGGGNDVVDMLGVFAARDLVLDGHAGNDTMKLTEVEAVENFFALMGDNDDTLDLTFVKSKAMTLDGGAGFDRLERHQMPFIPSLTVRNWELINGVPQPTKRIPPTFPGVVLQQL